MSSEEEKRSRRNQWGASVTTVISISLVLFVLGLVGLIVFNAQKLSNHVKENIGFSIILKDNVKEVDVAKLQKSMDAEVYVKSTDHVTKQEAVAIFNEEHGEDFVEFLGYIPLPSSIDVKIEAAYANPDSIAWIKEEIVANPKVKELWYHENLLEAVNENVRKISIILIGFSGLLLLIATALINNSIRLSIFSKRFLIRSMQLVGATKGFIRRPFVFKGIGYGIYASIIAIGMLMVTIYYAEKGFPSLFDLQDLELFLFLFGSVMALGILITWVSTFFAVRKYLRIKPEKLF